MSVDFPNEAARCQRFLSERAQSSFEPRDGNGPAGTRPPCYLMQNTRSKDRVRATNSVKRAVAQLGRAPGSGPGGRGFKSHQPDKIYTAARAKCSNQAATVLRYSPDLAKDELSGAVALDTAYYEAL